jgi:prepilin-type N-terminal cleavage/methylation domain-containing protein
MRATHPYAWVHRPRSGNYTLLGKSGYTLIELIVVMALIGIMLGVSAPKIRETLLSDPLKGTARKMMGVIHEARNESIRMRKAHALHMDMETNRFWMDTAMMSDEERDMARKEGSVLPDTVRIRDVWLANRGKKSAGETGILFSEKGYVQPSAIHLACKDGRQWTLVLSPFIGKVKIFEKYVDFFE